MQDQIFHSIITHPSLHNFWETDSKKFATNNSQITSREMFARVDVRSKTYGKWTKNLHGINLHLIELKKLYTARIKV